MFETKRTPQLLSEAKRLYMQQPGLPLREVGALVGLNMSTIRRWARDEGWPVRARPARLPAAREAGGTWRGRPCPGLRDCPEREAQVAKAWAVAEAQIDALAAAGADTGEGAARSLAMVVRTLKALRDIDAASTAHKPAEAAEDAFDDIDSLRDELARRLGAFDAESEAAFPGQPAPGRDAGADG